MKALSYGTRSAMNAECCHAEHMPSSMPAMSMCMFAAASTVAMIMETGVLTSVSLFVLVSVIVPLLLVGLVIIISLLLTGLTGLARLESLVGFNIKLATRSARGE